MTSKGGDLYIEDGGGLCQHHAFKTMMVWLKNGVARKGPSSVQDLPNDNTFGWGLGDGEVGKRIRSSPDFEAMWKWAAVQMSSVEVCVSPSVKGIQSDIQVDLDFDRGGQRYKGA